VVLPRLPLALAAACLAVPAAAPAVSADEPAATGDATLPPAFGSVIPKPLAASPGRGVFTLNAEARIELGRGAGVRAAADQLARHLRRSTGYALPVSRADGEIGRGAIRLTLQARPELGAEGYELRVARTGVTLAAHRGTGLLRGIQTLRQLLPVAIESQDVRPDPWRIRTGTIRDRPRFEWRGAMLDVARHFFDVPEVKRYLDLLALYKLNRLHLHLTDDQGWRIEIRSWPRLAVHGGSTEVGGGRGGYYTQTDYRTIVSHAHALGIEIVPEIDMPGHVNAALASYPELSCDGRPREHYTGIPVPGTSLCVGRKRTNEFVADVLREVAALTPGRYLHIGGDEATSTPPAAYAGFIRRVQSLVRSHGKRMIGWEEIARSDLDTGAIVQHWRDARLVRDTPRRTGIVMSPATKAYLDMKYDASTPLGLEWAGHTNVRDSYEWDPASQISRLPAARVLGVEAPLWTETVATRADLETMAFPRLIGIAELGWSPATGRSWAEYRSRLGSHGPRLRALGVRFHPAPEVPWR
jgi:hexosaminidase